LSGSRPSDSRGFATLARVDESKTRVTLLGRLARDYQDPAAWSQFVDHYGPKIHSWCRAWGLQDADAEDVTQHVLLKLARRLRDFRYEPSLSFRAWLKTLTHHAWRDYLEAQRRPGQGSGDSSMLKLIGDFEAPEQLAICLQQAFDQELLEEAMARVRLRVEPRTWEAFRLLALDDWSGAQAAEHLRMKVATVFVARSKVTRMIREEVARLNRAGMSASAEAPSR
jgi:RNA polymerase sigma-70 factor (ECF subfamily)